MASVIGRDGVRLHVEETGRGDPVLFLHEFAGDHRSWAPQVAAFRSRYRCITYAARGYLPSDVPTDPTAYTYERAVDDAVAVLDGLEVARAHVVGLSMGGYSALQLGIHHPARVRSLVVAGAGSGASPATRDAFRVHATELATGFRTRGAEAMAQEIGLGPSRVQLLDKDPEAWATFVSQLGEHSSLGSALTMLGVQRQRPSLWEVTGPLSSINAPTLIIDGDEDDACLEAGLLLKRAIAMAALVVLPRTGHACNLEDPAVFNRTVQDFLDLVESGAWMARDPRSPAPDAARPVAQPAARN